MSFLTPLFLLGSLAIAAPVIFHLIRRTTRERTIFSSLMFLLPSPPRVTRRSRLEHILLLVLRCGVLCLLAVGFARPFVKKPVSNEKAAGVARRMVVLIDTSASMRRANLWADARAKTESILRKTSPADEVTVATFDRQLHPLVTFEQWNSAPSGERAALAMRKLADTSPGWSATHLGNALISTAESLADTGGKPATGPRQIILITDLQEGSHLDQLQGYEWPRGIDLTVEPIKAKHSGNAGLQLVTEMDDADPKSNTGVRVRVSNAPDAKREQFKVGWATPEAPGFIGQPTDVYVPPGQSRIVRLDVAPSTESLTLRSNEHNLINTSLQRGASGEPQIENRFNDFSSSRILLQGDEEDFDNVVFVIPPETARSTVLYLGGDSGADPRQPLFFLRHAFQETRRQVVQVLAHQVGELLPPNEAQAASLLVVTDSLPEERVRELRELVTTGKTLVFVITRAAMGNSISGLLGVPLLSLEEAHVNSYAMFGEIDFRHPLFAPFADPRFSDFTKVHFWKYRRIEPQAIPGARTVASFDSGDPAILEVPLGKGRVFILASGWHPEDSQLALSTKFVPMLYALLEQTGGASPLPMQYQVGDTVPLAPLLGPEKSELTINTPDGSKLTLPAGETNFSRTTLPGIYTIGAVGSAQPLKRFAVNLDPAESRTAPLPLDELERLGAPIAYKAGTPASETQRKVRLQNAELESRQKLWRWLIVGALAVLLLETWLAARSSPRNVAVQ